MSTNPSDEQQPPSSGGTPPPPPAGGSTPPPGGYAPPPGAPQAPYAGGGYATQPPLSDSDQRMWATLAHVGGIFLGFIAPLVVWLIFKGRGAFVDDQAKEALNWQITVAIGYLVGSVLSFIGIGFLLWAVVWIAALVLGILAAVAANKGEAYRYPFAIRLIS